MNFEDLQKANETINTTNIKGKEYAEVNQRIKAFRMLYPDGSITTEMISNENGVCIFRATVINDKGDILSTGTAYEKENSSFINKTSYIENCETSAIGRALGIAGFGIDTSIASAEEVENAILQQEGDKLITKVEAEALLEVAKNKGLEKDYVMSELQSKGYEKISEIKQKDYMYYVKTFESFKGDSK